MRKKKASIKSTLPIAKRTVAESVRPLLGRPYALGGNGKILGAPFDCFGLMIEYIYYRYNIKPLVYHEKEKFDFDGYHKNFDTLKESKKEELLLYLKKCFLKVRLNYLTGGELLFCEAEGISFVGIYCGLQRMLITTPETGCITVGTEHYKIKDAFRCPLRSH